MHRPGLKGLNNKRHVFLLHHFFTKMLIAVLWWEHAFTIYPQSSTGRTACISKGNSTSWQTNFPVVNRNDVQHWQVQEVSAQFSVSDMTSYLTIWHLLLIVVRCVLCSIACNFSLPSISDHSSPLFNFLELFLEHITPEIQGHTQAFDGILTSTQLRIESTWLA